VQANKKDFSKRMKTKETEKLRKKKLNLIIKEFKIREITDETGEVTNDTVIQISFEGILITLSIAAAMKLGRELSDLFDMKKM
jgi:predicted unusual protein kinase regulating ubiquinone biosynthesis (AarF/ABC1/UbiB family)